MTLRSWIILIASFGWIIIAINFLCFSRRLDAEGHSTDVKILAEDKVTDEIQPEYGVPTLDTFRIKCDENNVWKVTGRWRVDSRESDDSTEYVCIAHGRYEVFIEYRGREDRHYADNCAMYDVKDVNVFTDYIRGQE